MCGSICIHGATFSATPRIMARSASRSYFDRLSIRGLRVLLFKCSIVQMFYCSIVRMFKCSIVHGSIGRALSLSKCNALRSYFDRLSILCLRVLLFKCSIVLLFNCPNVLLFNCSKFNWPGSEVVEVQCFAFILRQAQFPGSSRSIVLLFGCSIVRMFKCSNVLLLSPLRKVFFRHKGTKSLSFTKVKY